MTTKGEQYQLDWGQFFVPSSVLPQQIFLNQFNEYLFFDADLGSSEALILVLQKTAYAYLGANFQIEIFASFNGAYLGCIDLTTHWFSEIQKCNEKLKSEGNYDGLILIDKTRNWIAYQSRPIDVGILAFSYSNKPPEIKFSTSDCFFNCDDISNWLTGRSQNDVDIVSNFGRDYLAALVKNYCSST